MNRRFLCAGVLGALLLVFSLLSTACKDECEPVDITLTTGYEALADAIGSMNKTLSEKLSLIEQALQEGFADQQAAHALIRAALEAAGSTLEEKLSAVQGAVKAQGTSLEAKLGLIETAVVDGLADGRTALGWIRSAIEAAGHTVDERLAAIEAAVASQTTGLGVKLGLIGMAVQEGFADAQSAQELLKAAVSTLGGGLSEQLSAIATAVQEGFVDTQSAQALMGAAIEALDGSATEKLSAIEAVVQDKATTLSGKLALIEAAVSEGLSDSATGQALLQEALASLGDDAATVLAAIEAAVTNQTTSLSAKLGLIEAALSGGFADRQAGKGLLKEALTALGDNAAAVLSAIGEAVQDQARTLEAKLDLIEAAVYSGFADEKSRQDLLGELLSSLGETLEEQLAALEAAVNSQTTSLGAKLALIEAAVQEGFADAAAGRVLLEEALEALSGTVEERLSSLEEAMASEATSLEMKLEAVEAAVAAGFADSREGMDLIEAAVASLSGDLASKLSALDAVVNSDATTLLTKLGAIQAALAKGFADSAEAAGLVETAVGNLKGSMETRLGAIESAVNDQTKSLETKIYTILAGMNTGITDAITALGEIVAALVNLKECIDGDAGLIEKIDEVVSKLGALDTTIEENVAAKLTDIGGAIAGQADYGAILASIEAVIENLDVPLTIEFEKFVTGSELVMGKDTILKIPYILPEGEGLQVTATASEGIRVSVEPDPADKQRGSLAIGASEINGSSKVEVTVSSRFKSLKHTLKIIEAQITADPGQDLTLTYEGKKLNDGATGPFEFRYRTNTSTIVSIPDTATWIHRIYDTEGNASTTDSVVRISVDPNKGFYERWTGVTIISPVSKTVFSFSIYQDYNSTKIIFDRNNGSLESAFVGDTRHVNFNKDNYISMAEAAAVTSLDSLFGTGLTAGANYNSFDEFQYFTGIDTIPAGSFHNWNNLTSITLPSSIKIIEGGYGNEDGPFTACPKLESIKGTFPVDSKVQVYDDQMLVYDKKLLKVAETATSVTIPSDVVIIGTKAFYKSNVKTITIPSSVKTIRDHAFEYSQVETVTFAMNGTDPSTAKAYVDSLAETSFAHCFKLRYFEGPESGTSTVRVTPDQLCLCRDTTLYAFAMGSRRTEYAIPESAGVRRLAASVFSAVSSNSSETNPSADPSAVQWQKIGLPSTLTDIGDHAFSAQAQNQGDKMEVWFKGENPPKVVAGAFDDLSKITFFVPAVKKSDGTTDQAATDQRINQFKAVLGNSADVRAYAEWYAFEGILIVSTIPRKRAYDPVENIQRDWLPNEHIAVLYEVGGVRKRADARIVSVDDEGKATIRLEVDKNVQNGTSCSLVYPLSAAKDDNTGPKSYSYMANSQDGTLEHCLDVHEGSGTIQTGDAPALRISDSEPIKPLYGLLNLILLLNGSGGPCDVKTLVLKYNDLTVTIDAEEMSNRFYLSMLPLNGGTISLDGITTSNLHYLYDLNNETIEAGEFYVRRIYLQ